MNELQAADIEMEYHAGELEIRTKRVTQWLKVSLEDASLLRATLDDAGLDVAWTDGSEN